MKKNIPMTKPKKAELEKEVKTLKDELQFRAWELKVVKDCTRESQTNSFIQINKTFNEIINFLDDETKSKVEDALSKYYARNTHLSRKERVVIGIDELEAIVKQLNEEEAAKNHEPIDWSNYKVKGCN